MSDTATMPDMLKATAMTFPWHELYVPDADAAREFYKKGLGWDTENFSMGDSTYKMLKANGAAIAGVMGTHNDPNLKDVPPHWAIYIAVDDVDARLAKCQALGAVLVHGPMDIPTIGRMALIQDPQGAHFWIFKPEM